VTDNIRELPSKQDDIKGAVEALRRNLPVVIEHYQLVAEVNRAIYLAYVQQGFTEEQSLDLVKATMFGVVPA
jgi:Tfp pilus assembly protein PilO